VGGPVPDLVNALDLSKNSARALILLWVLRMSEGILEVRSPLGCVGGLCRGGNHVRYGCKFSKVHHKGLLLCQPSYRSHLDSRGLCDTVLGVQIVPVCP